MLNLSKIIFQSLILGFCLWSIYKFFEYLKKANSSKADKKSDALDSRNYYLKSRQYFLEKKWQDTIEAVTHTLAVGRESAELLGWRGTAYQALEWHYDAIDDFSRACEIEPNNCLSFFQRGVSKSSIGDEKGFISDFNEAIRLSYMDDSPSARSENSRAHAKGYPNAAFFYKQTELLMKADYDFIIKSKKAEAEQRGRYLKIQQN